MKACRNPRCGDLVSRNRRLCPSCRLAFQGGAVLMFVANSIAYFADRAMADVDWLALVKGLLGWVFER